MTSNNLIKYLSGSNIDMLNCYGIIDITKITDDADVQTDEYLKKSLKCIGQNISEDADEKSAAIYLDMCGANSKDIQKVVEVFTIARSGRIHYNA